MTIPSHEGRTFEDYGQDNGFRFWWARDLAHILGYGSYESFRTIVNDAVAGCFASEIEVNENFEHSSRLVDGISVRDIKLSRFACYLVAVKADARKPQVQSAQVYLAAFSAALKDFIETSNIIDRLLIREEVSKGEKSLGSTAKQAGVMEYALFKNAGYRGMYNMNYRELVQLKGIELKPGQPLFDFMGREELAGNLFRITQTEAKIRRDGIRGQRNLEVTAEEVGQTVRNTMEDISGTSPEYLQSEKDIRAIRSGLKKGHKDMKALDKKTKSQPRIKKT